jgi:hypothetical protein
MSPLAATAASEKVILQPAGVTDGQPPTSFSGQASFTVSNTGTHPVTVLVDVAPQGDARREWFTFLPPTRIPLSPGTSAQCTLQISVPAGAKAGTYAVGALMKHETQPEEIFVQSPLTAFEVPASEAPKKRFPWWIAAIAAVVLIGAIVSAKLLFGSGDSVPPGAPADLTAVINGSTVVLSWSASTDNDSVEGYEVSRNGALLNSVGSKPTSYADLNVVCSGLGAHLTYSIVAIDASGNQSIPSTAVLTLTCLDGDLTKWTLVPLPVMALPATTGAPDD